VTISLAELVVGGGSGGAVSAMRAFRLFRIVKLARSWESLKLLLDSIAHTVAAIGNFTVLLGLFIYVYSLLGMQFFAGQLKFDENGNPDAVNGTSPRANFDILLQAFITIFQVLVGENWNEVMYTSMRSEVGWISALYFITLVVLGNIIMLNLFLAILLGNFDEASVLMNEKKYFEKMKAKELRSMREEKLKKK
jgi:voltage-dependent calcium channel L type alpha-1D